MLIKVRKAQVGDIDAMVTLLEELFSIESDFNFNPNKSRKALEMMIPDTNENALFIADSNGHVAGMCSVQTIMSTAEGQKSGVVEDVIVAKKFRRNRIGSLLLDAAGKWALNKGVRRLQLLADITNNAAIDFYRFNHWSETQLICLRKYTKD